MVTRFVNNKNVVFLCVGTDRVIFDSLGCMVGSILKNNKAELEDRVWRSFGILKYARKLTSKEATSMLSDVLTGINMGIIKTETSLTPMELIVGAQPAGIGTDSSPDERDVKRAEFIRNNL